MGLAADHGAPLTLVSHLRHLPGTKALEEPSQRKPEEAEARLQHWPGQALSWEGPMTGISL